jgi:tetratricopeptide (TPR) repeat protein
MDSTVRRRRTRESVKSLVLRESLNQALLLIFEDLHWIDDESEALLNLLADSIGTARILMIVNYRPEYRHQWGNKSYYTQLRLDPLGNENAAEMLSALLALPSESAPAYRDDGGLAALQSTIIERTEGNPFFMEEMVQVLFDQGVLMRNGIVKMVKPLASIQIPPTVKGILAARIDKLGGADKSLLQTLAVIGKEFPLGLMRRVSGNSDEQLGAMLASLQLGEFIYEQPAFPESDYTFKHALTQEVAYDSMLIERRRQIHERAANAIEAMYPEALEDHVAELAHHYSRSANVSKAVEYLYLASVQARSRSAYSEALRYNREGLALIATMPPSRERDRIELKYLVIKAPVTVAIEGFSSTELNGIIQRAQELCRQAGNTGETLAPLFWVWGLQFSNGNLEESRQAAQELLDLSTQVKSELGVAGANSSMGSTLNWLGECREACTYLNRAIATYDVDIARYLPMTEANVIPSRCQISWALWAAGFPDQATRRIEEAETLAHQLGRPFSLAFALTYAVALAHLERSYDGVRAKAESLIELARDAGFLYWQAAGKMCLGRVIAGEGDPENGIVMLKEGVEALRATGAELVYSYSLSLLAEVQLILNQPDESAATLALTIERIETRDHRVHEPEIYRLMGMTELMKAGRDNDQTEQWFRRAIEAARKQQALSWELRASISLAQLLAGRGKTREARELIAPVYAQFTEGFATYDLQEARTLINSWS